MQVNRWKSSKDKKNISWFLVTGSIGQKGDYIWFFGGEGSQYIPVADYTEKNKTINTAGAAEWY